MKLIKPAEIAAKIMTLIDEAEKELIIVSPYNKITGWTKLINRIKKAQSKGVAISWYSRKNDVKVNNSEEVKINLGVDPILVDDLHAKIYMNEEYAIFTSMNMSKVSDDKSIDLGFITETNVEYDEVYNTFLKHIKSKSSIKKIEEPKIFQPSNALTNEAKFQRINSEYYYVNAIHEHLQLNYGTFAFTYKGDEVLEYFEFINSGYRIEFIPFSQAIKVHIFLPSDEIFDKIEGRMNKSTYGYNKLYKKSEFEFCNNDDKNYVKYYFELYSRNLQKWGSDELNHFLKNIDIIINLVFGNL